MYSTSFLTTTQYAGVYYASFILEVKNALALHTANVAKDKKVSYYKKPSCHMNTSCQNSLCSNDIQSRQV